MKRKQRSSIISTLAVICISLSALNLLVNCDKIPETPPSSTETPPTSETPTSEYTITYVADGEIIEVLEYTDDTTEQAVPEIPQKEHYTAEWSEVLLIGGDRFIKAEYTPIEYTVTFIADGEIMGTHVYTIEDTTLSTPSLPAKDHYRAMWEGVTLDGGDKTVNAVYTPIEYNVIFVADETVLAINTYTVESTDIIPPAIPKKENYLASWEDYTLDGGNKVVNAVYEEGYTITYIVITDYEAKNKTNLFEDSYWSGAIRTAENGYSGVPENYYQYTYKPSTESQEVAGLLVLNPLLPKNADYGEEYRWEGYFWDEACTQSAGMTSAWSYDGGNNVVIPAETKGDIIVYVKMTYAGEWETSPW